MPSVIVGAGPIGLFLAYSLAKKGVHSILIDPRMGQYYRPGHYAASVFEPVCKDIGDSSGGELWLNGQHIKDLERFLYQRIQNDPCVTKIKGRFVGFGQGACSKVIYKDENDQEQAIATNYVFDCSGSARTVFTAAAAIQPSRISLACTKRQAIVRDHLLFYCYVSPKVSKQFHLGTYHGKEKDLEDAPYVEMMTRFQNLGWPYPAVPTFTAYQMKDSKFCVYCEIPPGFSPELYHDWVNLLVSYRTGIPDARVYRVPTDNEEKQKLRWMAFRINYSHLPRASFKKRRQLPNIIALGDAMMGPDYRLAHGARAGLELVKDLMLCLTMERGEIQDFSASVYQKHIEHPCRDLHQNELDWHMDAEEKRHQKAEARLARAKLSLMKPVENSDDPELGTRLGY